MTPRRIPTEEEARQAIDRLLLSLESGSDIFAVLDEIRVLHPKYNTFPGEVFVRLAAHALAEGNTKCEQPISEKGIVEAHLPECEFRGRDNHKIRYALLAGAATNGGVEVDLLEEVVYWGTDDFWSYAALAAVAWIRAVAHKRQIPLTERKRVGRGLCHRRGSGEPCQQTGWFHSHPPRSVHQPSDRTFTFTSGIGVGGELTSALSRKASNRQE